MKINKPINENLIPTPQHTIQSVCVFCGSGHGNNPAFKEAAASLGHYLATNKLHLIYGGGDMGLMGTLAKNAAQHGGQITGIIPDFLQKYQHGPEPIGHQIVTQSMHERKAKMYELAHAFIALPGGIGTLEELVETMTWEQLGQHTKPIILLNKDQFWEPFLELLTHMKDNHFIRPGLEVNFHVVENVSALNNILQPTKPF